MIPAVALLAAVAIIAAGSAIGMRKRLSNSEEARRRLKAGWETKLREEEHRYRKLQQELSKTQEASKRLQDALEKREKEEQEQHRTQAKQRDSESVGEEPRGRSEKQNLDRLTGELTRSIERLSQLQDEMKRMIRELHRTHQGRDRTEEQGRAAQKQEQPAHPEREIQKRDEKETTERFGPEISGPGKPQHSTLEEQVWLYELIKQSIREENELRQKLASEDPSWKSEKLTLDNDYKEFIEQLDVVGPCLQEKGTEADAHPNGGNSSAMPGREKGKI